MDWWTAEIGGGTVVGWLILGWLGASLPVALLVGRGARDRTPPAPTAAPSAPRWPMPALDPDLVAVHGVVQMTSVLEGALANLRSSYAAMDAASVEQLLATAHDHATTAHHVLEGLLAGRSAATARLDALGPDFHIGEITRGLAEAAAGPEAPAQLTEAP